MVGDESGLDTIRVLIIEDDERLAKLTATYLGMRGMIVTVARDGKQGLTEALAHTYDAVVLDLMLPGISGLEVCAAIRRRIDVPILMVTALGEVDDRIKGLEMGADDYIPKPFSSPELVARIQAAVRRFRGKAGPSVRLTRVGDLSVDPKTLKATLRDEPLDLTSYEFAILRVLAEHAGKVLSRERILDLAKGSAEAAFERSIDGHISRLRKKLGDDRGTPKWLRTIRGSGYMLALNPDDADPELP